jgi:hypothetical protein
MRYEDKSVHDCSCGVMYIGRMQKNSFLTAISWYNIMYAIGQDLSPIQLERPFIYMSNVTSTHMRICIERYLSLAVRMMCSRLVSLKMGKLYSDKGRVRGSIFVLFERLCITALNISLLAVSNRLPPDERIVV